jgi:hypothetical protein
MVLTRLNLEDKINNLHKQIFGFRVGDVTRFNPKREPLIDYEIRVFERFYNGLVHAILTKKPTSIWFDKKNRWNLIYPLAGELYRDSNERGDCRTYTCMFDNGEFNPRSHILYCFACLIVQEVSKAVSIKGEGFPKYLIEPSQSKFYSKMVGKLKSLEEPELLKKLLRPRKKSKFYVRNQRDAIRLSKELTDEEVYSLVREKNIGEFLSVFKDIESFKKAGSKLFEECKKVVRFNNVTKFRLPDDQIIPALKRKRVVLKTCKTYIRYLALMSVIQFRVQRPIEITSSVENTGFGLGYKVMSDAANNLKWKILHDPTFCKGIRSRSYVVRVCFDKAIKFNKNLTLNNLESKFMVLEKEAQALALMEIGIAGLCILERIEVFELQRTKKRLSQENTSAMFKHRIGMPVSWYDFNMRKDTKRRIDMKTEQFFTKYGDKKNFRGNFEVPFARGNQEYRVSGWS